MPPRPWTAPTPSSSTSVLRADRSAAGQGGLGPFVTFIEYERPDGLVARWDSRRHRKQVGPTPGHPDHTWWAPRARGWWIAVLFVVGSALFAVGAVPGYAGMVGTTTDSVTFFIGSLFFTAAGFLQYRESVDAGLRGPAHGWGKVVRLPTPARSTGGPPVSS